MAERRLITAMEEEIAAKIAEIQRQTDQAVAEVESLARQVAHEAEVLEKSRTEQQLTAYRRVKRRRFENEWRLRLRDFQFEVAERVFTRLEALTPTIRERPDYPAIWSRLFTEALQAYREERSDKPILCVAVQDRGLADSWGSKLGDIEADATVHDGVELFSPDRRLQIKNTLASRLRRGRDQFLKDISDAIQERLRQ